jgi:hypothetical protein
MADNPSQNGSSSDTDVRCPAMVSERLRGFDAAFAFHSPKAAEIQSSHSMAALLPCAT